MTTATEILASAERFTLTEARHSGRPGTRVGTFVHHGFDETYGVDGTLHQVIVSSIDDHTVAVHVSLNGTDVRLDDLDVFGRAVTPAVRDEVARFLATQVAR